MSNEGSRCQKCTGLIPEVTGSYCTWCGVNLREGGPSTVEAIRERDEALAEVEKIKASHGILLEIVGRYIVDFQSGYDALASNDWDLLLEWWAENTDTPPTESEAESGNQP